MTQLRDHAQTIHDPAATQDQRFLSWLEIDLRRLDHNLHAFQQLTSQAANAPHCCAVIKKNAYGLGAGPIAHRLLQAGADMLAVYSPAEAEDLIRQSVHCPILMLMPLRQITRTDVLYRHAVAGKLHLTVHDLPHLQQVNQIGRTFGIKLPIHLYLDTGMSRAGLTPDQFQHAVASLPDHKHVNLVGIGSHLATADDQPDFAYQQLEQFQHLAREAFADQPPHRLQRHIANTYATLRDRQFHLDMIRPGLGLLGFGPEALADGPVLDPQPQLQPVLRWMSRLVHIQNHRQGHPVGYGSTHQLQRDSRLGVIPVGYGDGYPLALSNRAVVRITPPNHESPFHAPLLGRVNMDQLTVDLTDIPVSDPAELLQAEVELISNDPAAPNALPALAEAADSHCYEALCRLSPSLPRRYLR